MDDQSFSHIFSLCVCVTLPSALGHKVLNWTIIIFLSIKRSAACCSGVNMLLEVNVRSSHCEGEVTAVHMRVRPEPAGSRVQPGPRSPSQWSSVWRMRKRRPSTITLWTGEPPLIDYGNVSGADPARYESEVSISAEQENTLAVKSDDDSISSARRRRSPSAGV